MSRLLSCKKYIGLLGLGILLAGCNSLTDNKLNISEELQKQLATSNKLNLPYGLPKQLVLSQLEILKKGLANKEISDEVLLCMAPLFEENGFIKGKIPFIPDLFDKIRMDSDLLGSSDNRFQFKGILDIKNIESIKNITDISNVIKELAEPNSIPFSLERLLNFNLTRENEIEGKEKIRKLTVLTEIYFDAYFSPAIESVNHIDLDKPGSGKNASDSAKKPGFVARDGSKYSFSGFSKTDGKLSIDHNQIGADMIRIILEAMRDAFYPIPASKDSTLNQNKKKLEALKFNVDIYEGDENPGEWKSGGVLYTYNLNKGGFSKIETSGNKSEATVATAAGKAIRGGFIGSLNNEALAKSVETAIGVLARQTTERFEWCSASKQKAVTQKSSEVNSVLLTGL